jgi:hypothetical protein
VTWWAWTLLWVVLVTGAASVFFVLGRSLWRKASALIGELGAAAERLSVVSAELSAMAATASPEEPAVFADPTTLRRQRYLAARAQARTRDRGHPGGARPSTQDVTCRADVGSRHRPEVAAEETEDSRCARSSPGT